MMYEGVVPLEPFVPSTELDAWTKEYAAEVDLRTYDGRPLMEHVKENQLWGEIRRAARTNKTLQSALEECIIIYKLSKEYTNGT
jgi:hypothetical protein